MKSTEKEAWSMVPLGQLLVQSEETTEIQPDRRYRQVTVRLWGEGVVLRNEVSGTRISARKRRVVHTGQFILSRIDARNGAFGLVPESLDGAVVSNDFPAFDVNRQRLEPSFLAWMSKTETFVNICQAASEGTTNRVRLKVDRFLDMPIPFPPLDEQRHIVARVEELAALIEEAQGLRLQAREEAEAIRASAAAEAFTHVGDDTVLTKRLAEVRGGIQKSPDRIPGDNPIRYLTVAHVQRNHIVWSDPRFFEVNPEELERWILKPGDILVVEGNGSAEQIGRTALFQGEVEPCVHQNHLIRVRAKPARVLPEYLNAFFNSPLGKAEMLKRSRTTSGLFNLSVNRIESIAVPFCSLDEQHRIVAYLDGLQAQVDELAALQVATQAELDALLPSVLDRAFRGEF